MTWRVLQRLQRRSPSVPAPAAAEGEGAQSSPAPESGRRRAVLVDGHTRTWWSRGEDLATTLVEADAGTPREQPAGWVRLQGVMAGPRPSGRPRANPAFTEALFVELMRAGQLRRAFAQLSPECQASWGSVDSFVAAQPGRALRSVQGVEVRDVRYLEVWTDPTTAKVYADVAELDVEYRLAAGGWARALRQTVHLVPVEGRWRSVYHPPSAAG